MNTADSPAKTDSPRADVLGTTVSGFRGATLAEPSVQQENLEASVVPKDLVSGTRIGHFRVDSVIASGGMGTVYKATQLRPIRRVVALKTIRASVVNESTLLRFHRERQALAQLNHPDIAHIYEADTNQDGQPYFAMEYCEGLPIDEYCTKHCLSVPQRLQLVLRIANAVDDAHREGIIHRDLKPSNILVADDRPVMRIIDFGIAKFSDEQSVDSSGEVTKVGEVVGTPAYMSPEQALSANVDARADVFAIGAILFKLLTGTTPLKLDGLSDVSFAQVIELIRGFETDTLSHRIATTPVKVRDHHAATLGFSSSRRLMAACRRELDWIALKSLESDRTRRYATAADLAADLSAFLTHRPVTAVAPSWVYRLRKLYQRRKATVVATVISSIAILTMIGVSGISWWEVQQERQVEIRILETEFEVLLRLADHARQRAVSGKGNALLNFTDAEEALSQAMALLASEPKLTSQKFRVEQASQALQRDRETLTRPSVLR